METNIMQALQVEEQNKQQVVILLTEAVKLLRSTSTDPPTPEDAAATPKLVTNNHAPYYRPAYVERAMEVLREAREPLAIAEITRRMRKKWPAELGKVTRPAIERAVFIDINRRKSGARMKKVGPGLYWVAGEAMPQSAAASLNHHHQAKRRKQSA